VSRVSSVCTTFSHRSASFDPHTPHRTCCSQPGHGHSGAPRSSRPKPCRDPFLPSPFLLLINPYCIRASRLISSTTNLHWERGTSHRGRCSYSTLSIILSSRAIIDRIACALRIHDLHDRICARILLSAPALHQALPRARRPDTPGPASRPLAPRRSITPRRRSSTVLAEAPCCVLSSSSALPCTLQI
jgi:hypothetical protein